LTKAWGEATRPDRSGNCAPTSLTLRGAKTDLGPLGLSAIYRSGHREETHRRARQNGIEPHDLMARAVVLVVPESLAPSAGAAYAGADPTAQERGGGLSYGYLADPDRIAHTHRNLRTGWRSRTRPAARGS
jgi:hypothetical protein